MKKVISMLLPLAALLVLPMLVQAQDTASAMRGRILDESGNPVDGVSVVILDTRTGVERQYRSNSTGTFLASALPVGGPYRVTINGVQTIIVPSISLGETYNLTVDLGTEIMEEIVTVGQVSSIAGTTAGPSVTFSLQELDSAVAFNRDIKDVYAIDPRLNIDGFQVNCAGKHPRFNSITLDGVSHNDRFGLSSNGYSTATGMPFPYDSIQQVTVELAPYDSKYGGFSACTVNAVTKSGNNQWQASAFYEYTTQDLINDELDGADLSSSEDYTRETIGVSAGGAIIKDRLFIFAAYEETDEPRFLAAGYDGSGSGEERSWLSQADYNTIVDASNNLYMYDPGGQPGNGAQVTENYLVRLDWNISDSHNAAVIYNYYEGSQTRSSDSDPDEFEFRNHFYTKGSISETTTLIVNSQWTDAFSTEFFYTDSQMDDSQITDGPPDMGDHQIELGNNTIYLGADDSRQANFLFTESQYLKLHGQYLLGNHVISGGIESEELRVFNIFVQHSQGGEWDYDDNSSTNLAPCDALDAQGRHDDPTCGTTGIDKFVLGRPTQVYYGSGGLTNVATDAAGDYTNTFNAVFIQDEIYFANQDLTLTAGLRYEWVSSDDHPNFNEALSTALGIRNDSGIDGINVLMPRIGVSWGIRDDLTLRGGIGLFSGGNPTVWLSNGWTNDGVTMVQTDIEYNEGMRGNPSIFDGGRPLEPGRIGGAIPTEMYDLVAATGPDTGATRRTNLIDPDYEQPSEWKLSVGGTWDMPWGGWTAELDYMYSVLKDGAIYVDPGQEIQGTTLAGAPIYGLITPGVDQNLMLTNTNRDGTTHVISAVFTKDFENGLDLLLGYAYTNAEDVSPMTSFTAGTSFSNLATNFVNDPRPASSNYNVENRVTLRLAYARDFWGDNTTRFTLMGFYSDGQPSTYTLDSEDLLTDGRNRQSLLYVPDGPNDPNVVYDPNFDAALQTEFFAWINKNNLKPGFVGRNSVSTHSSTRLDLRIDQEFPLGVDGLKARAYLKIYNFTNMLNSDWGRVYDAEFFSRDVVDVSGLTPAGAYIYEDFSARSPTDLQTFSSLWELRLGLDIRFH